MIHQIKRPLAVVIAALCLFSHGAFAQESQASELQGAIEATKLEFAEVSEIFEGSNKGGDSTKLAVVLDLTNEKGVCKELVRIRAKLHYRMTGGEDDPAYGKAEQINSEMFILIKWCEDDVKRTPTSGEIIKKLKGAYDRLWPPKPKRIRVRYP